MDWRKFVEETPCVSVPRIKASRLGFAYRKVSRSQSSTLLAFAR